MGRGFPTCCNLPCGFEGTRMRLYIDSADLSVVGPLMETGIFYGVTTNPVILKKCGIHLDRLPHFAAEVFNFGAKEVYFQSWGEDRAELYLHGKQLHEIGGEKGVIKLPATREGITAATRLAAEGIKICITAVYAPFQVLLAASAGATYVAPYLGRMNDAGRDGHGMIAQMSQILCAAQSHTRILAASIRGPEDIAVLAQNGVHCATLPPAVAEMLFHEDLTLEATRAFEEAARTVAGQSGALRKGDSEAALTP